MNRTLLSPKIDFVFKKIFGSEENKSVLISFLNATLKPKCEIVSVDLKNTDIEKEYLKDKFSRLDVKATTSNNEIINIEIQMNDQYNMTKRTLYYWSKLYEEQMEQSDNYRKLNRTICINILNYNYLKNNKFHNIYRLKEIETNEELTDICEIHFIEIPKLRHLDLKDEADMLEVWIEFLRDPESEVIRNAEQTNNEVKKAKDKLYKLSQNKEDRELYYLREKSIKDEVSALSNAEQKGIEKGREEGLKEGENNKAIEIAKTSIENGLDDNLISTLTGLPLKEIKDLRNKLSI